MKPFATPTVAILALVAIVHLLRLLADWSDVSVNGIDIPMWVSVIALVARARVPTHQHVSTSPLAALTLRKDAFLS
jgi:hypothetical protein